MGQANGISVGRRYQWDREEEGLGPNWEGNNQLTFRMGVVNVAQRAGQFISDKSENRGVAKRVAH